METDRWGLKNERGGATLQRQRAISPPPPGRARAAAIGRELAPIPPAFRCPVVAARQEFCNGLISRRFRASWPD